MKRIFVFGSNLKGVHGKGAALHAFKNHGAIMGQGVGLQGDSYAIPTKITPSKPLSLISINKHVADFIEFASIIPHVQFNVTPIGCGLAGFKPFQIAPMFYYAYHLDIPNIELPIEFTKVLANKHTYQSININHRKLIGFDEEN